ncbi:MAG: sulfite exporter TauE/SafE family protein [Armatimonadetes bacterium]|nr:sulfite exporter TauE/SafE family protein [Armatimonadota bacterium]
MPLYVLCILALIVAVLYSTVGHGGASGYLAAMALAGMAPAEMKPTALALNILVAGLGSIRYLRAGQFEWRVFWPCAVGSIPFAFLGGSHATPDQLYKRLLAGFLILAAIALLLPRPEDRDPKPFPPLAGVTIGAAIGYVSGLIGVGGGIFLSPILILSGWVRTRSASGISALFILVNSIAGLAGNAASLKALPSSLPWLALAAFVGGLLGTELGSKRLAPQGLRIVLCAVMLLASWKLATA